MNYNLAENMIKKVNSLIRVNKFDEAKTLLNEMNGEHEYKLEFKLLAQKLEEKRINYNIKTSGLKGKCDEFISLGNLNFHYDDFYVAYQYYMAGAYLTSLP